MWLSVSDSDDVGSAKGYAELFESNIPLNPQTPCEAGPVFPQRGLVICSRSHSRYVAESAFKSRPVLLTFTLY